MAKKYSAFMSKTFLSFRVKYMIRSCAFVLCAMLVMNGKISMAAAPVFARHTIDTMVCSQGVTQFDLATMLGFSDPDVGETETFSQLSGPTAVGSTSGGSGNLLGFPGTASSGVGVVPSTGFKYAFLAGSYGIRTFKIKVSDGANEDSVTVNVHLVITPPATITSAYNYVHVGRSTTLSGNYDDVFAKYGSVFNTAWSSATPAVATVTSSGVVGGATVGTSVISFSVSTPTCGISNANYGTFSMAVVTNIPPQVTVPSTPVALKPGQTYTITGSGFNTTPGNYVVYFGAIKATVGSVTPTTISVTVPKGATQGSLYLLDNTSRLSTIANNVFVVNHDSTGFIQSTRNNTYNNSISGVSLPATGSSGGPYSIEFGDFDGDGRADAVVSGSRYAKVIVYRNISAPGVVSNASFAAPLEFTVAAGPICNKIADFDGDGKLDIASVAVGAQGVTILRNISTGSGDINFASREDVSMASVGAVLPSEISIADFNRDGRPDIAVAVTGANDSASYIGSGWTPSTPDKIGRLVIITNNYSYSPSVALAAESFSVSSAFNFDSTSSPISVATGDLNKDGYPEVVVSLHHDRRVAVFKNNAGSGFAAPTYVSTAVGNGTLAADTSRIGATVEAKYDTAIYRSGYPEQVRIGDIDGDGNVDLAIVVTDSDLLSSNRFNVVQVVRNTSSTGGAVTFGNIVKVPTGTSPVALALGDLDGDGMLDIVNSNAAASTISVIYHTVGTPGIAFDNFSSRFVGFGPVCPVIADIDNNKIPDIAVVNRTGNSWTILRRYPTPDTVSISGDSVICLGGSTTLHSALLVPTPDPGLTSGTWSVINDGSANVSITGSATDTIVTIQGNVAGVDTVMYTVVGLADTNRVKYVVRVSAIASAGTISIVGAPGSDSVCIGANVTLTSTNPGGTWSSSTPAAITISSGGVAGGVAPGGSTVITYSVSGCASSSTFNMHTGAVANAGGSLSTTGTTICPTQTSRLRLSPTALRGGTWAIRGTAVTPGTSYPTTDSFEVVGSVAGSASVVYIYTNACGTDSVSQAITVNTSATAATIAHSNDSVCVGSTVTLNITAGTTGGAWSVLSGPAVTVSSTASSTGITGTGLIGGTAIIRYAVASGCGSPVTFDTITVSPNPGHVTISGPTRVCTSSTISLSVPALPSGIAASWSAANGFSTVSTSGVVTGVSTGVNTISYTQSNICATIVDTKADTVSVAPTADVISGPTNLCTGSTLSYSGSSTLGAFDSRVWASSNTSVATVVPFGTNTANVTGVASGSTNITTTINGCSSVTSAPYGVVVDVPLATGSITGATHICSGSNTSLTYTGTGGSASSWSVTPGLVASGVSATGITITPVAVTSGFRVDTTTYTATSSCGSVTTIHIDTTFENPTAGVINGPATSPFVDSVCPGLNYAVSVAGSSTISLTSAVWSTDATSVATITGSGSSATVFGGGPGNTLVRYTVTSQYCGSATTTRPVKVPNLVTAGTVTGPTIICTGTSASMTATGATPGGTWTSASTTIAPVNAISGIVFGNFFPVVGGSTRTLVNITYSVTGSCNTATATSPQRIDGVPNASNITTTVPGGQPLLDSICLGGSLTQTATPNVTAFPTTGLVTTWSVVTGNLTTSSATQSTVIITGSAAGADTIVFRIANTCGADTARRPIKILPPPLESHITGPAVMCFGAVDTFRGVLSDGTVVPGSWSYQPFGTGTPGDNVIIGTFNGIGTAFSAGVDRLVFTPVSGFCGSDTSTYDVTVVLPPDAGVISGDTTLCVGAAITLTNVPAVGDYWYSSDTSVARVDSFSGVVTAITAGGAYIVYADESVCGTDTAAQHITVRALAEVGYIYGQDTSCIGGSFQLFDTVSAAAGGIWSATGAVTINSTGVVTAVSPGLGVVTYTTNNDCGVNDTTYDIRVYGNPNMSSATTINLCDSAQLLYTPTSDTATTTFAWTRATVTGISNVAASGVDGIDEYLDNVHPDIPVTATYVYTLTAHGCTSNQNVSVSVSPTPHLTSPLFDTICSGSQFVYLLTTNTAAASTTATWSRAAVAGISPASNTGTGNISETLTGVPPLAYNVVYVYTLNWTGCPTHTEEVNLQVQPTPAAPQITTHSPADVCTRTLDQNFGAATVPPAGVTYTWTATGAQVWATGNTRQYSLVNFTEPGDAVVYLLASISGYQCATKDSFKVAVGNGLSDLPEVIYFNGDFVCLSNDQESYQWGWDDRGTLDSAMFVNETNQNFREANPDFTNKYYWVITTRNGCMQKSYFNPPTGIKNVTASMGEIKLYPNPAERFVNVEINNTAGGKYNIEVVNLLGQKLDMKDLINNKTTVDVSDLANGVYFINCYRDGVKFASAKFVKN